MGDAFSRRDFLRLTAGVASAAAIGAGCNSGSDSAKPSGAKSAAGKGERTLRIAQWNNFVPAFDAWFDNEYTPRWGDEHGVRVTVDHFPLTELNTRAAAEVAAQRGHDLFQFTASPSAFEEEVIDHRELIEEVEGKLGPMAPLVERSVFNPKTNRFFGFSESWVPNVLHYRTDLWEPLGRPDSWQQILAAAPGLQSAGNPVGIGMSSVLDFDSSWSLLALMHAYGSSVQDEAGNLTINTPATLEAVKLGVELYRSGMTEDIFQWDASANNRYLASGRGSLILNAISAVRAIEAQDPELAAKIALLPTPDGPSGRHAPYVVNVYVIWKFAENQEAARQFLVDLALASRDSVVRSDLYGLPSYPGAVPDLGVLASGDQKARPPGKYSILAEAESWSTNVGYPGYANAAMDEVFNQTFVPKMFAAAARGDEPRGRGQAGRGRDEADLRQVAGAGEDLMERTARVWSRRGFLRLTAGAAAATAAACGSGSKKASSAGDSPGSRAGGGERTLRIAQWIHPVPAYDQWFDQEYTQRWGAEHDVKVTVDRFSFGDVTPRASTEISAGRGHDLFGFLAPPSAFEDDVIDVREVVEQVEAELGPMTALAERNVLNPKTMRYIGFPEFWSPFPVVYRTDLWESVGLKSGPDTWDDVRRAAPALKAAGHPIGFAFSSDIDANWSLMSLMHAYGASIQNEAGAVVIERPATVEALKVAAAIYRAGMTEEVFTWDALANNRFMANGTGSMTLNPISALRAVEKQDPELAGKLALAPVPAGPVARFGVHSPAGIYVVWRFAENQELAKQFLVDLALGYREAFVKSEFFNIPAFAGSVRDLDSLVRSNPAGDTPSKYAILADATAWSTNIGHPGHTNAAVDEVFTQFIVPKMFATVAKGEMSAEDAARAAQAEIEPIFGKWKELGKL